MIRYLTVKEVLELHRLVLDQSGGLQGIRDFGGLESALAQPQMRFDGLDLYPTLAEKAAALGFSLVCNHPSAEDDANPDDVILWEQVKADILARAVRQGV